MQEAIYEGKRFHLTNYLEAISDKKSEIGTLKKRADKGAFRCPYCLEDLIIKSGEIRDNHFAHRYSKSCEISFASDVYHQQIKRESKLHSQIKDIIYDELKSQEKLNTNIKVEYGFINKAKEKWRYYPDIILKNKNQEIAITILTNITANKNNSMVKQIKNRNKYYKEKNMKTLWFFENAELTIDLPNHVIHLWEAELDIALKTKEDIRWEKELNNISFDFSLFDLFNYHYKNVPKKYDVRSLYYVYSTETSILFKVNRFIVDETKYPYKAFAINSGYMMSLTKALWTQETIQLSDTEQEIENRKKFLKLVEEKIDEKQKQVFQENYVDEDLVVVTNTAKEEDVIVNTYGKHQIEIGKFLSTNHIFKVTSYEDLQGRHSEDLKKIQGKEDKIPEGLLNDWKIIQNTVIQAKNNESFDYEIFRVKLENLKIPLKIE